MSQFSDIDFFDIPEYEESEDELDFDKKQMTANERFIEFGYSEKHNEALEVMNDPDFIVTLDIFRIYICNKTVDLRILKCLIDSGIDLNQRRRGSELTLLMLGCRYKHLNAVKMLLQRGADPDVFTDLDLSALKICVSSLDQDIFEIILKLSKRSYDMNSLLVEFIKQMIFMIILDKGSLKQKRYFKFLKRLLELGADINTLDDRERTPLMNAVTNDCRELAQVILEAGANVNIRDPEGQTALCLAVKRGNTNMVKILGRYLHKIEEKYPDTMLVFASGKYSTEMKMGVQLILERSRLISF